MTGRELRNIRLRLGWTQAQMAEKLRIARNTVSRYEREDRPIPGPVELAVRFLIQARGGERE